MTMKLSDAIEFAYFYLVFAVFKFCFSYLMTPFLMHFSSSSPLGFKWQRQLMFRSKLTMHTAYDRKDNAEPASITALTVSRDHKILYVGKY